MSRIVKPSTGARRGRPPKSGATVAPTTAENAAKAPVQTDWREFAEMIANAVDARLMRLMPVFARLAAADSIHTTEKPETVMRRAIAEGKMAADILKEQEAVI